MRINVTADVATFLNPEEFESEARYALERVADSYGVPLDNLTITVGPVSAGIERKRSLLARILGKV